MLVIWGRLSSINVRKVIWAAREVGAPFEHVNAGGQFGVVETPAYLSMNPNALVPLIDDAGFRLWESNVIVRYLCAKHAPGTLYPAALTERFDAERWMDWQQTTLNPAGRDAFVQLIRKPASERDPALISKSKGATESLMGLLDHHLSTQTHVAGHRFTMADIPIACEVHRWWGLPQQRPAWPHLQRWYESVLARPATRGVLDLALS